MSALTCILLVALSVDKSGAVVRPVVTFTPNWENILSGDAVTLTCDVGSAFPEEQGYHWYKDYVLLDTDQQNLTIHSASRRDTGNYQCRTSTSDLSGSYYLYISPENIILQRPQSVFEGRPLTLRCRSRSVYTVINTTFYMDDGVIQSSAGDSGLYIERVDGDGIQQYRCRKVVQDVDGFLHTLSADYCIYVNGAAANFTSVVTLTPDWRPVLFGDVVVMTCDVGSSAPEKLRYYWYKDCRQIDVDQQNITIRSASYNDAGEYQCKTSTSDTSDPLRLEVSAEMIILQGPESIYEGGPLALRCHIRSGYNVTRTTFYKGNEELKSSITESLLYIHSAHESGPYRCGKEIQHDGASSTVLSALSSITVIRLFEFLEIKVSSYGMTEGENATLTCLTSIRPVAALSQLRFAFYRNGHNVQDFSPSDMYRLQAHDSGRYTCEVMALPGMARKMSKELVIPILQIQDYTLQNTIRLVLSGLIVMAAAGFILYHNKPISDRRTLQERSSSSEGT